LYNYGHILSASQLNHLHRNPATQMGQARVAIALRGIEADEKPSDAVAMALRASKGRPTLRRLPTGESPARAYN
jgi:hypothetical protein